MEDRHHSDPPNLEDFFSLIEHQRRLAKVIIPLWLDYLNLSVASRRRGYDPLSIATVDLAHTKSSIDPIPMDTDVDCNRQHLVNIMAVLTASRSGVWFR